MAKRYNFPKKMWWCWTPDIFALLKKQIIQDTRLSITINVLLRSLWAYSHSLRWTLKCMLTPYHACTEHADRHALSMHWSWGTKLCVERFQTLERQSCSSSRSSASTQRCQSGSGFTPHHTLAGRGTECDCAALGKGESSSSSKSPFKPWSFAFGANKVSAN